MQIYKELFIGGRWVAPAGTGTIEVVSPHDLGVVGSVPDTVEADVDAATAVARSTLDSGVWSRRPPEERIAVMRRAHDLLVARQDEFAQLAVTEIGCPSMIAQAINPGSSLGALSAMIDVAEVEQWEEIRQGSYGPVIVRREPVGVVAAVIPWNSPQFTLMTKLAPALLAGCSVVVKPAPEAPLDAFAYAELFAEAGLPPGVLSVLPAGREVGEYLVGHHEVDKVAFTGSTDTGRRIASLCGERLKRVGLELGGKSAAILLDDVDLSVAVPALRFAALVNSGQACTLHSRILAPRSRQAEVVDAIAELMSQLKVGDPADPTVEVGPLIAERQLRRVNDYIELGSREGARRVLGGTDRPVGVDRGWYARPTLFADVSNDMRIAREEIFGPVLAVIPYDGEEEAVRIANDSDYGLAGSVYTADGERGLEIARRVRTGAFAVNHFNLDFKAPFGGVKQSGMGRELGVEGLHSYIEMKAIIPSPR